MSKPYLKLKAPSTRYPHGSVEIAPDFGKLDPKVRRVVLNHYRAILEELTEGNLAQIEGVRLKAANPHVVSSIVWRGRNADMIARRA